jgi:hypothetical protein
MVEEMFVGVTGGVSLRVLAWPGASGAAGSSGAAATSAPAGFSAAAAPIPLLHGLASTARIWEPVAIRPRRRPTDLPSTPNKAA